MFYLLFIKKQTDKINYRKTFEWLKIVIEFLLIQDHILYFKFLVFKNVSIKTPMADGLLWIDIAPLKLAWFFYNYLIATIKNITLLDFL